MKFSFARFAPKWYGVGIFLLVWVSIWLCIFLFMLQPLGGVISLKYGVFSGGIGLLLTLPIFVLMWLRTDLIKKPPRESILKIVLQALFFCIVIWLVLPLPSNVLLAPTTHINLSFQGEKSGFVDIIWLRSDLGDIPFQSLKLNTSSQIEPESIRINLDTEGKAELSWIGRAWKQVSIVMKAGYPVQVTSTIDSKTLFFDLDPKINKEYEMVLPVKNQAFYQIINLLVLPFFFITVGYLLFLFVIIFRDSLNPIRFFSNVISKTRYESLVRWTWVLITLIFTMLAFSTIATGFINRMYMDDFCDFNIIHRHGFLGARS